MRHQTARSTIAALGLALLLLVLTPGPQSVQAAGIPEDECKMDPSTAGSICAYVTNRVLRFGDQPGVLAGTSIVKDEVRALRGYHTINGPKQIDFNDATYDKFVPALTHGTGLITYRGAQGTLAGAQVSVRADHEPFTDTDPDKRIGLTCQSQQYLTCETYPVWMKNRTGSAWYNWVSGGPLPVSNVIGFATIESRPLIVKVLNMTEQPLERDGSVRSNAMLRSTAVGDPKTIAASVDDRTGVGYFHFYRDPDRAASATFFYAFRDGPLSTSLTGGVLEFTVNVAADGSTDASKCTPPTGILQNVECSVTMLGDADGTLTALVAVGV